MLHIAREELINVFDNYSAIVSQAKYTAFQKGLKILASKCFTDYQ